MDCCNPYLFLQGPRPTSLWISQRVFPRLMGIVVDRMTKYSHFTPLDHPYSAKIVTQLFVKHVFKHHDMPQSIVLDRDNTFTSLFWRELFKVQEVQLAFSMTYHPKTDDQSEAMNKTLETYLRCFVGDRPKDQVKWVLLVKWQYNISPHSLTKLTPFEALYGYPLPPSYCPTPLTRPWWKKQRPHYNQEGSYSSFFDTIYIGPKQGWKKMQTEREINKLSRQMTGYTQITAVSSVAQYHDLKLALRFYGPFQILSRVREVVYQFNISTIAHIHPIFHISQLKKHLGKGSDSGEITTCQQSRGVAT